MFALVEDNNWEDSVYFDLVRRRDRNVFEKEEKRLFARIGWRDKRILELKSENEFDTLALDTLRCEAWVRRSLFSPEEKGKEKKKG